MNVTNEEIYKIIVEINKILEKDCLCIPFYDFSRYELKEIYNSISKGEEIKIKIRTKILMPKNRASQFVLKYEKLDIFSERIKVVINYATIAYYEGNYICSYLSLIPVIESLLRKTNWIKGKSSEVFENLDNIEKKSQELKGFAEKSMELLDKKNLNEFTEFEKNHKYRKEAFYHSNFDSMKYFEALNLQLISFLKKTLGTFFTRTNDKQYNKDFTRHGTFHFLDGIDDNIGKMVLNNVRLFLIIDCIAELYSRTDLNQEKFALKRDIFPNLEKTNYDSLFKIYCGAFHNCLYNYHKKTSIFYPFFNSHI